jgi:hypothetical protein
VKLEEYFHGGPRVEDFLKHYGSPCRRWDPPAPDGEQSEAEWGFDAALREDVIDWARARGRRLVRLVFREPEDLSPLVADLYRWWYRRRGRPADRLVVDSFFLLDPWWTLRTGAAPYWAVFNTESSAQCLAEYLERTEPYEEIYAMLLSNMVDTIGGVAPAELRRIIGQHARRSAGLLGVDERQYPRDFGTIARYHDHLLAAPVLQRGRDQRNVYLPAGRWYRLDTGEAFAGGRWVTVSAPRVDPVTPRPGAGLAGLPIFVPAGAVVIMQDVQQYVGERRVEELECHVWAGGEALSELYEDAGDGYEHEAGAWRLTRFNVRATPEALTIRLACEGDPAFAASRFRVLVHGLGCAPSDVRVGGAPVPFEWRGSGVLLTLEPIAECEIRLVRSRSPQNAFV